MDNMNLVFDGVALTILIIAVLTGIKRGVMKSVFKVFSSLISISLAFIIHPYITKFFRMSPIYSLLKDAVADKLGLNVVVNATTQAEQTKFIANLPLPDFLNEMIIENNNSVVHSLLDTHTIADYICGYVANFILSIAVAMAMALIIKTVMKIISKSLNLFTKLPVIHQLNSLGGGMIGLASGVIIIWLIFMVTMLFVTNTNYEIIQNGIDQSVICKILYDNNLIRDALMGDLF